MNQDTTTSESREFTGTYVYIVLCVAALGLLVMLQLSRTGQPISRDLNLPVDSMLGLLIAVVGGLGVYGKLRSAPVLILLMIALPSILAPVNSALTPLRIFGPGYSSGRYYVPPFSVLDTLAAAALLAFTIGHYRLLGISESAFPIDARLKRTSQRELKKPWRNRKPKTFKRSPALVSPEEIGLVVLGVPVCAALAQFIWWLLAVDFPLFGLSRYTVRFIFVGWALLVPGIVISGAFRLWRQNTVSDEKAELITQDVLWQDTRREQRRISQWLVWKKMKRSQREDTP